MSGKRVLFLCTSNSCRSIMAEALLRHHFGDGFEVFSAGVQPTEVSPNTLKALEEKGIDTSGLTSKGAWEYIDDQFDLVVTVCDRAREACPFFAGGKEALHMGFRDPPELPVEGSDPLEGYRKVRDEIDAWVRMHFGGA